MTAVMAAEMVMVMAVMDGKHDAGGGGGEVMVKLLVCSQSQDLQLGWCS